MLRFYEAVLPYLLWPFLLFVKSQAARQAADATADIYARAQQAENDGMPELAAQLRAFAASLTIDAPDKPLVSLPQPSTNGHVPQLPEPVKPGRPRKEASGGN